MCTSIWPIAIREATSTEASAVVRDQIKLPAGYAISWSGQYEAMERVRQRLTRVIPLTLLLCSCCLYANTRSRDQDDDHSAGSSVLGSGRGLVPVFCRIQHERGVWVGLIALLGIDAETGIYMLLYLELAYDEALRGGRLRSIDDLNEAIVQGAVKRLRPKFMTFATMSLGLLPIMWSIGTGADVMKRIAAPMLGGIFTSFLLELLVYPAIYGVWRQRSLARLAVSENIDEPAGLESLDQGEDSLVTLKL